MAAERDELVSTRYPDLPVELPADPIAATLLLEQLYRAEWDAAWNGRADPWGGMRAVVEHQIGWWPPLRPGQRQPSWQPLLYLESGSPPATLKPAEGWHAATEQTSSNLCSETLSVGVAIEKLQGTAGDPSANADVSRAARARADLLIPVRDRLTAQLPPSSRAWLQRLRDRLSLSTLAPAQPAPATPLRPR